MISDQSLLSFELEQFRQLYYDVQRQRDSTSAKFAPTISLLSAFCAVIGVVFTKFAKSVIARWNALSIYDILLSFLIVINICSLVIAIIYCIRCFLFYKTRLISPNELESYFVSLEAYKNYYQEDEIIEHIKKTMLKQYMKATKINQLEIAKHNMSLMKCFLFLIICLISLAFSYIGVQFVK